ncbi:hypothetical protein QQ045_011395 [Rhodiola kirilowii]
MEKRGRRSRRKGEGDERGAAEELELAPAAEGNRSGVFRWSRGSLLAATASCRSDCFALDDWGFYRAMTRHFLTKCHTPTLGQIWRSFLERDLKGRSPIDGKAQDLEGNGRMWKLMEDGGRVYHL